MRLWTCVYDYFLVKFCILILFYYSSFFLFDVYDDDDNVDEFDELQGDSNPLWGVLLVTLLSFSTFFFRIQINK